MKVLFACGSATLSENIAKKYLENYSEKLEYKDVYFFKAVLEEVKRDKSYDRVVINETLERISTNVVSERDKMLFNNIDSITDEFEAKNIIFICSDDRGKGDSLLSRLYNIGVFNFLVGDERQIPSLCKLIRQPRGKKQAKDYLDNKAEDGSDSELSDDQVDDVELLNIKKYFEKLNTDDEYIKSFGQICEQYSNPEALKTICAALTLTNHNGEAIFSALNSDPRYSVYCTWRKEKEEAPISEPQKKGLKINLFKGGHGGSKGSHSENLSSKVESQRNENNQEELLRQQQEELLRRQQEEMVRRQQEELLKKQQEELLKKQQEELLMKQQEELLKKQQEAVLKAQQNDVNPIQGETNNSSADVNPIGAASKQEDQLRKHQEELLKKQQEEMMKRQQEELLRQQQEELVKKQQEELLKKQQEQVLKAQPVQPDISATRPPHKVISVSGQDDFTSNISVDSDSIKKPVNTNPFNNSYSTSTFSAQPTPDQYGSEDMNIPANLNVPANFKKIVAFVGTNKVGTSFMLNSIGNLLAANGVKTSILDVSKNRGLFWFYDKETSSKAKQLSKCMSGLSAGVANPIQVGKNKNLSMFTAIPGSEDDNRLSYRHRNVVDTASNQCSLLLIDCDFTTPLDYFEYAQEVYVVCDLDLVKGRETVEFLRKLQAKGIDWDKLRLIVNNTVSSKITPKVLRDDVLTIYYDANSTFNEDIDEIKEFYSVPMDPTNYAVYVESIANSRLSYNQYSDALKKAFEHIAASILGNSPAASRKKGRY